MPPHSSKTFVVFLRVFISVAAIMTAYEALKEAIFKGMLTPWQSHTITILITSILSTIAAFYIRSWSDKILQKEHHYNLHHQKLNTLRLVLGAVHHVINNFLNHFQLIQIEVSNDGTIKEETMELLEKSIADVTEQLKIIEQLEEPDKAESYRHLYPK